jgi:hypothetical protein
MLLRQIWILLLVFTVGARLLFSFLAKGFAYRSKFRGRVAIERFLSSDELLLLLISAAVGSCVGGGCAELTHCLH